MNRIIALFSISLIVLLSSCLNDNPIVGTWKSTETASNGELNWEHHTRYITFYENGTIKSSRSTGDPGKWEMNSQKDSLYLTNNEGYINGYSIVRLTENEMILSENGWTIMLNKGLHQSRKRMLT
ncbi:MAG: lipocalin family protein [Crocinitomicaceae bacterium]|nr:lipocalin family protein [Crocinitomicaceae bacterium]